MLDISVIIPAYNAASFLEKTINSVLNQTSLPKEIIIIDDGSIDATQEIIKSFDFPIRYFYQSNKGSAAATNKGIRLAESPYLALLDHDDLWHPKKLEQQSALFLVNPKLEVAYCRVESFFDTSLKEADKQYLLPPPMKGFLRSCILFKKSITEKVGYFQENLKVTESIDWISRINDANTIIEIVPEILVSRRIHKKNTSTVQRSNYKELLGLLKQRIQSNSINTESKRDNATIKFIT